MKKVTSVATHYVPRHGTCTMCCKDVDKKNFCWGCNSYICEKCEKFSPEGQHKLEDHVHAIPARVPLRRYA